MDFLALLLDIASEFVSGSGRFDILGGAFYFYLAFFISVKAANRLFWTKLAFVFEILNNLCKSPWMQSNLSGSGSTSPKLFKYVSFAPFDSSLSLMISVLKSLTTTWAIEFL